MKRGQLIALAQAFPPDSGSALYYSDPWTAYDAQDLVDRESLLLREFDIDSYDLFRPIRDPRLVATELTEGKTTLLTSNLLDTLSCAVCGGICKDTMVVKDCSHRFCGDCIQKWLRTGDQSCPTCKAKIPSRRALRHDDVFNAIIQRLFPDLDKFERERGRKIRTPLRRNTSSSSSRGEDEEDEDKDEEEDEGESSEIENPSMGSEDEEVSFAEDEEEMNDDNIRAVPARSTKRMSVNNNRQSAYLPNPVESSPRSDGDGAVGSFEVFLVCLNHNLPPAVCSMARELSKRPLKFPADATTRKVGLFLASKIVRDVLGPCNINSILPDLSFVREGEIWPAMADMPISDVCRAVTESRGPIALRYLLSDRLFTLCEQIEYKYSMPLAGGPPPGGGAGARMKQ